MASQRTGFPSLVRLTAEQHSFGASSEFEIHLKAEGFADSLKNELFSALVKPSGKVIDILKIQEILQTANFTVQEDQNLHFEAIVKINGQTIYCHHLNETTFKTFADGKTAK